MTHRILVPLDGSSLSELALHDALTLAQLPGSTVFLLHVIPPIETTVGDGEEITIDQQWENRRIQALGYLRGICGRAEWRDVKTDIEVELGKPAQVILDFARRHKIQWIVMSTHGRSGVERWVYGSVADKVLRGADRTVVLVRAGAPAARQEQKPAVTEAVAR